MSRNSRQVERTTDSHSNGTASGLSRNAARDPERHSGGSHRSRGHDRVHSGRRSGRARSNRSASEDQEEDKDQEKYVVPAMPMPVAVVCCVLNFIIPGTGSMVASFAVLCCARTDGMTCRKKCTSCCTVFGIGLLQLLLTACFLVGWIWSCIWGITFIGMSATYFYGEEEEEAHDQQMQAWMERREGRHLPTPQVVVNQPYPGIRYADLARIHAQRQRQQARRPLSRISLHSSNLIYPLRAPSSLHYYSPPPEYQRYKSPPPGYQSRMESRESTRDETMPHGNRETGGRGRQSSIPEEPGEQEHPKRQTQSRVREEAPSRTQSRAIGVAEQTERTQSRISSRQGQNNESGRGQNNGSGREQNNGSGREQNNGSGRKQTNESGRNSRAGAASRQATPIVDAQLNQPRTTARMTMNQQHPLATQAIDEEEDMWS